MWPEDIVGLERSPVPYPCDFACRKGRYWFHQLFDGGRFCEMKTTDRTHREYGPACTIQIYLHVLYFTPESRNPDRAGLVSVNRYEFKHGGVSLLESYRHFLEIIVNR
jgi:hypothetical protein